MDEQKCNDSPTKITDDLEENLAKFRLSESLLCHGKERSFQDALDSHHNVDRREIIEVDLIEINEKLRKNEIEKEWNQEVSEAIDDNFEIDDNDNAHNQKIEPSKMVNQSTLQWGYQPNVV